MFVRILRHSTHLQKNSVVHWSVWLGCTFTIAAVGFLIASGVPIFSFLIALAGSVCCKCRFLLPSFMYQDPNLLGTLIVKEFFIFYLSTKLTVSSCSALSHSSRILLDLRSSTLQKQLTPSKTNIWASLLSDLDWSLSRRCWDV